MAASVLAVSFSFVAAWILSKVSLALLADLAGVPADFDDYCC